MGRLRQRRLYLRQNHLQWPQQHQWPGERGDDAGVFLSPDTRRRCVFWGYDQSPSRATLAALGGSKGFASVTSTQHAFLVKTVEGPVFTWGLDGFDHDMEIPPFTLDALNRSRGFDHVVATDSAFLVRTAEGGTYAWGMLGIDTAATIPPEIQYALDASKGFEHVAAAGNAFLVRTIEGGTCAWGDGAYGGEIPPATHVALDASKGFANVSSTRFSSSCGLSKARCSCGALGCTTSLPRL